MKKITLSLIATLVIVSIGICFWKGPKLFKMKKTRSSPVVVVEEKPFVIIIPSYNNSAFCEKNLFSVLTQKYQNYRVIYIDDCSKDDTYEKVQQYLDGHPQSSRVTLIHNAENRGALANLYHTIHQCKDEEIIVTVDGDDYLAHEHVLTKLNRVYAQPNVWMTYGNYLDYPSFVQKPSICAKIPKKVIQNNSYRSYKWVSSHLRTFYAGLFKQIKQDDLLYDGMFLPMGWDLAIMMPMLEMSGSRAVYIRDILYLYNRTNVLSDHIVNLDLQTKCADYIRHLPQYHRLKSLPINAENGATTVNIENLDFRTSQSPRVE